MDLTRNGLTETVILRFMHKRRDDHKAPPETTAGNQGLSLKSLFFGFSDLLFNLDSRLWQTLIGLVWRPLETNRRYFRAGDTGLLNPLKLLTGLCALAVVLWSFLPGLPSFSEMFEVMHPELSEEIRTQVEAENVSWVHFTSILDRRMSMLNVPFILLASIPIMLYLKLIRRDRPLVEHAVFTLNCFNVYILFLILSAPIYWLDPGYMLASILPMVFVLVPYLLVGLWVFYHSAPIRYLLSAAGLLLVSASGYFIAANASIFVAFFWTSRSVLN